MKAIDSVDEVELREWASLAGPNIWMLTDPFSSSQSYDPCVSPIGTQRRAYDVQRIYSAGHVPLLHVAADYIQLWGRISVLCDN